MRQHPLLFPSLAFGYSPVLAASKYEESVKELAEGVASEAIKMKKSRLAVLDFVDSKGDVTPIGQFLAEELATHLLVAGELKVVDHKLLAATMAKHQLTHLETSQAKAAKKVAKALRADLFVTGAYLEIPEGVQVTAKLIGPYTVYPVGAARAIVPKAGPLATLLKQANAPKPPVAIAARNPGAGVECHENEWYQVTCGTLLGKMIRLRWTCCLSAALLIRSKSAVNFKIPICSTSMANNGRRISRRVVKVSVPEVWNCIPGSSNLRGSHFQRLKSRPKGS